VIGKIFQDMSKLKVFSVLLLNILYINICSAQIITDNPNDSITNCNTGEVTYGEKTHKGGINFDTPIGTGLIRNQLSPTLKLGLRLVYDNHIFIPNYTTYYLFEKNLIEKFEVYSYTFLGLHYLYQIDNENAKGLGISYLTNDSRNHFQNNTLMFSYINETKFLQIIPSLICSDNFKKVFPSLTINYKLF
jgi:hypothetical protein